MNLTRADSWFSAVNYGGWSKVDASRINADGSLKALNANERAFLPLTPPGNAPDGVVIRCTWAGTGSLQAEGERVTSLANGANSLEFKWILNYPSPKTAWLALNATDPSDPVRQLDCREAGAPTDKIFADQFLDYVAPYGVLRFLDWQGTNGNSTARWQTRPQANSFILPAGGVPLELMVALANQANADPWFLMPWNADEDYIRRFAKYVHDNLRTDRRVYVELSNEVWNWAFPVTVQAEREARELGIGEGLNGMARRYSQKAAWALKIWTEVFADRPNSLVRVVSTQNGSAHLANLIFEFGDTAQYVDALATAPYFGYDLFNEVPAGSSIKDYMLRLAQGVDQIIANAANSKAIADKYGKRYITYEGGQHIISSDVTLLTAIQRNPAMYDIYTRYLTRLHETTGDLITLYNSTDGVTQYGAWGLREYQGQPLSETPKLRAVQEFAASH